ncbi:hypothetical protein OAQ84_00925 [Bdellovibrionales bacterium]|nr:hypothetical protein [Bdellovibrionales bacterium]
MNNYFDISLSLASGEIGLNQLVDLGILKRIKKRPNVYYHPDSSLNMYQHELLTARNYSERTGHSVALISSMFGYDGIPGVDGIAFNEKGEPVSNLSFKTALRKRVAGGGLV